MTACQPTLSSRGGTTLGTVELLDDETHDGAVIRRDDESDSASSARGVRKLIRLSNPIDLQEDRVSAPHG